MLQLEDFQSARDVIAPVLEPTDLQFSASLSEMCGHRLWLKPENLQKTGAFKIRGAYCCLSQLSEQDAKQGVVTASSGNHGAALAHAAALLNIESLVVMPEDAPESKISAVLGYGGEVRLHGRYADERKARAREIARQEDMMYIDSTGDEGVIAGHGTIALDILREKPDVDFIVGPVGGGGLMAGVSRAAGLICPEVRTVAVEPEGSSCMYASVQAGHPVEVQVDTVADGLRTMKPGGVPFEYIDACVDAFHQVSEALIIDAVLLLLQRAKLLVEPSGAVSLAGVLDGAVPGEGRDVAVVLTGGNADLSQVADYIGRGLQCFNSDMIGL